jgi:hypothetical protein
MSPNPRILNRIRSEYIEMPGLMLKSEQLQRLCGVDRPACQAVLESLVESGFLAVRSDGSYARSRDTDVSRARPAKATLESRVTQLSRLA